METKENEGFDADFDGGYEVFDEHLKEWFTADADPKFEEWLNRSSDPQRDDELRRKVRQELDREIEEINKELEAGDMDRRFLGWGAEVAIMSNSKISEGEAFSAIRHIAKAEVENVFYRRRSISDVIDVFKINRKDLPAFLAGIGVTFEEEVRLKRDSMMSLRGIAKIHGSSVRTVGKVLRAAGYDIRPGNSLQNEVSREDLELEFAKKGTINAVAKKMGIHWETSEKALREAGIFPKKTIG